MGERWQKEVKYRIENAGNKTYLQLLERFESFGAPFVGALLLLPPFPRTVLLLLSPRSRRWPLLLLPTLAPRSCRRATMLSSAAARGGGPPSFNACAFRSPASRSAVASSVSFAAATPPMPTKKSKTNDVVNSSIGKRQLRRTITVSEMQQRRQEGVFGGSIISFLS